MKGEVRVSAVQIASGQAIYDKAQKDLNVEKIIDRLEKEALNSDLIVFPELTIPGYIPLRGYVPELKSKFWEISEDASNSSVLERIQDVVHKHHCLSIVGFSERSIVKYETYNSAALFESGKAMRVSRKLHIPTEENHYFTPGSNIEVFDTFVGKLGIAICYDFMFPEVIRVMALKGAEIIIIISNILDTANFREMSHAVPVARAIENQVHVIFCNGCTTYKTGKREMRLLGETRIINSLGQIVSKAVEVEECVVHGTILEEELKEGASYLSVFRDRQISAYRPLLEPLKGSSK
jgi:predicted amidohydrolase